MLLYSLHNSPHRKGEVWQHAFAQNVQSRSPLTSFILGRKGVINVLLLAKPAIPQRKNRSLPSAVRFLALPIRCCNGNHSRPVHRPGKHLLSENRKQCFLVSARIAVLKNLLANFIGVIKNRFNSSHIANLAESSWLVITVTSSVKSLVVMGCISIIKPAINNQENNSLPLRRRITKRTKPYSKNEDDSTI